MNRNIAGIGRKEEVRTVSHFPSMSQRADLGCALLDGEDAECAAGDGGCAVEPDGLHQPRDALIGQDLDELVGRRPGTEVLLPAPPHHVQVQNGAAQLLWGIEDNVYIYMYM